MLSQQANLPHTSASISFGHWFISHLPTSQSVPYLCPGKAAAEGLKPWDPVPTRETRKKLLAPRFGSAQLQSLQTLGE